MPWRYPRWLVKAQPDIPPLAEYLPGYEASGWFGIGAPKDTPAGIVERLNKEIDAGLTNSRIIARYAELGATVFASSAADFGKFIGDETDKWGKVVRSAGMKPERSARRSGRALIEAA